MRRKLKGLKSVAGKTVCDVVVITKTDDEQSEMLKDFLKERNVSFSYIDIDEASAEDKETIAQAIEEHSPQQAYPVVVVDNEKVVIGFDEIKLMEIFA